MSKYRSLRGSDECVWYRSHNARPVLDGLDFDASEKLFDDTHDYICTLYGRVYCREALVYDTLQVIRQNWV